MKVVIAGPRDRNLHVHVLRDIVNSSGLKPTEIVSGGARGIDASGEAFARYAGIPIKLFPAEWELYGKRAGPRRNRQMAGYADALIAAIKPGGSKGTDDMIRAMRTLKKPVYTVLVVHPDDPVTEVQDPRGQTVSIIFDEHPDARITYKKTLDKFSREARS